MAKSPPLRILIPAIAVDSALIPLGLQADGTMTVPPDASSGGWYTGAPTPGELGPAVLVAHVDWRGRQGVFYRLRDLQIGANITVTRTDHSKAVFRVRQVAKFPKKEFPTSLVYGNLRVAGLRLITCGGSFDPAARSYRDNIIVFAELTKAA
jgi:sortase (surface protein transpeptidase)